MSVLYNVLVVGATGLVGQRLIEILLDKEFPINNLVLSASDNSIGRVLRIRGKDYSLKKTNEEVFDNIDICFFCSNALVSEKWGMIAKEKCKYVIDNSSYFRMDKDVPLIIPEINFNSCNSNYISNPNCSTIQALLVINEIRKLFKINRIIYSTYQSCSGGGRRELIELLSSYSHNSKKIFDHYLCDTCISNIGEIKDNHFSSEEIKMINETKKILKDYKLEVHASCIRVPVPYCHGVFIYLETDSEIDLDKVINQFNKSPRVLYKDSGFIYFQDAYYSEKVIVGRLKKDFDKPNAMSLFCVGDNLHVGAALNAYNIALYLIRGHNEND